MQLAPRAQLLDITHDIPPQDLVAGAWTLAEAVRWLPPQTIVVAVVDPGVGTSRHLLAARADQHWVIGPDNGLLALVLDRASRRSIVRLENRRGWLPTVSGTFHGRDIMAPVAARLALGRSLAWFGPSVTTYERLAWPVPIHRANRIEGRVMILDHFGNAITNLPGAMVRRPRQRLFVHRKRVRVVSSYEEGLPGELIAMIGSSGLLECAVRNGSAAALHQIQRGDRVSIVA